MLLLRSCVSVHTYIHTYIHSYHERVFPSHLYKRTSEPRRSKRSFSSCLVRCVMLLLPHGLVLSYYFFFFWSPRLFLSRRGPLANLLRSHSHTAQSVTVHVTVSSRMVNVPLLHSSNTKDEKETYSQSVACLLTC